MSSVTWPMTGNDLAAALRDGEEGYREKLRAAIPGIDADVIAKEASELTVAVARAFGEQEISERTAVAMHQMLASHLSDRHPLPEPTTHHKLKVV